MRKFISSPEIIAGIIADAADPRIPDLGVDLGDDPVFSEVPRHEDGPICIDGVFPGAGQAGHSFG